MSKWRLTAGATLVAALAMASLPAAQSPSLEVVLKRAAAYVAAFHQQLSGITAEERYLQQIVNTTRFTDSLQGSSVRRLTSDLLLVKPAGSDRYVELRDVFEVDGAAIRDRQSRLEQLLRDRSASAEARIGQIISESARYNIGAITRNINTPLMALQFLDAAHQPRFRFRHLEKRTPVFGKHQDESGNASTVFKVTTEMWTVAYEERGRNTIIRKPDGGRQPARGRFWINPADGSVLISELIADGGGVIATITVSYQSEPLMGFLVPIEMRESYIGKGERITGHAEYGRFRPIRK